jgi:hypothetical protein
MAGKYGSADVTFAIEDGPGGTSRAIAGFLLEIGGVKITALTEKSDTFGDAWEEHCPTGKRRVEPLTLTGWWDTTATTGTHAVLSDPDDGPNEDTREVIVVFGDSKTFTFDVRLTSYEVLATNDQLTRFTAELLPSGAGVWS